MGPIISIDDKQLNMATVVLEGNRDMMINGQTSFCFVDTWQPHSLVWLLIEYDKKNTDAECES